jgi:multiple antibiotic resistance protein
VPEWLNQLLLTFVPLFIVIDPLGNLPFVLSFVEKKPKDEQRKVIHVAAITAAVVGLVFLFFGQFVLNLLGISVGSFAIAGGLLLLIFSIKFIITGSWVDEVEEGMIAVVPIGTPLLSGPAAITTLLLLAGQFPVYMVLISFALNLLIAWVLFLLGNNLVKYIGKGGFKVISNVFNLLLTAIGISIILKGLELVGIISLKN